MTINNILNLSDQVILVALGSTKIEETLKAIDHCSSIVIFNRILYLTDASINHTNIQHIKSRNVPSIKNYQTFVVNEVPDLVLSNIPDTFNGHFLFINWDGFVVNPSGWTNSFLDYDYIGAPWPWFNHAVGNGGFCLKSKKFLLNQQNICKTYKVIGNEDMELSMRLREKFKLQGCQYATPNIGYQFSTEVGDYKKHNSFGFHSFKYHPEFKHIIYG